VSVAYTRLFVTNSPFNATSLGIQGIVQGPLHWDAELVYKAVKGVG
jgi:hypothetical protein